MAPPEVEIVDESAGETQVFSNKRINVCLTRSNYLLWKQQVVLTIRGLGLEGYLDGSVAAPAKIVRNRAGEQIVNPLYLQFVKQDSSLASWLLSTVSADILPQLVGSESTRDVWSAVTKTFSTLSTTKIMNLHCRLRSLKKGSQSMQDYTMNIKETCDLLAACRSPVSELEHVATILNGLPIEYEPSVAAITASKDTYSVDNVVSILIDAESRLEDSSRFPVGINFTKFNMAQGAPDVGSETSVPEVHSPGANCLNTVATGTNSGPIGETDVEITTEDHAHETLSTSQHSHSSAESEVPPVTTEIAHSEVTQGSDGHHSDLQGANFDIPDIQAAYSTEAGAQVIDSVVLGVSTSEHIYLRMDLYHGVFGVRLSKPIQSINPHSDVVLEEWGRCVGGTKAHESLPTWLCWWNGGSKKPPYMVVLEEWRAQGSLILGELSLGS
ncbi:hypothetical protein GQ457_06G009610 [Hibiscus cannabinus]